MNTADWVTLRQWDAARRSLMLLHPWFALGQVGLVQRTWDSGMRPGWNRVVRDNMAEHPVIYTRIAEGEGETTTVAPEVDADSIHDATRDPPDLKASILWSVLRTRGEELVALGAISGDEQNALEASIATAGQQKRELDRMRALWSDAMQTMRRVLSESRDGTLRIPDFLKTASALVQRYLDFDVAGMTVSEALAVVLSTQCTIPVLGPPEIMPAAARIAAVNHLADTAYDLLSRREGLNIAGYFEATYLAGLYCRTAYLIAGWAKASHRHSAPELEQLGKTALNLDELFAHRIAPVFVLHALYRPAEVLSWIDASAQRTGKPVDHYAEFYQLPPGLRRLLNPEARGMTEAEIEEAYRRDSDARLAFDARKTLDTDAQVVAEENRKQIMRDFLTMGLGSGGLQGSRSRR